MPAAAYVCLAAISFAKLPQQSAIGMHRRVRIQGVTPAMSAGNSAALTESSADMNQGELEEAASAVVVPTGSRRELVASAAAAAGSSALRLLPILAAASIASYFLTILLAGVSGPIAGGIKLIYAGAIAGIVSRTACAPLEMVSTLMMCRGNEVGSMWSELSRAWKTEGMGAHRPLHFRAAVPPSDAVAARAKRTKKERERETENARTHFGDCASRHVHGSALPPRHA